MLLHAIALVATVLHSAGAVPPTLALPVARLAGTGTTSTATGSASGAADAARISDNDRNIRARGEQLLADLQQTQCGFNGHSFSALTRTAPSTDWTTATADQRYSWCVGGACWCC
jgi:hypothetical protein